MRILLILLSAWIYISSAGAQQQPQRPPGYFEAERSFRELTPKQRLLIQSMLIADDSWQAMPNVDYSLRLHQAFMRFQAKTGFVADGILTAPQVARLIQNVLPSFDQWGFREVTNGGVTLQIPRGVLTVAKAGKWGPEYSAPDDKMKLMFDTMNGTIGELYHTLSDIDGVTTDYKLLRNDFFVVRGTHRNGIRIYSRFHQNGAKASGFTIAWDPRLAWGDRVVTLVSSSLYIRHKYDIALPMPDAPSDRIASAPAQRTPTRSAPTPPQSTPPASSKGDDISSGSGFFINSQGYAVTNAHVVQACDSIVVSKNGAAPVSARLLAADQQNDLAVLTTDAKPDKFLFIRQAPAKLGESIAAFGFPLSSVLSRNGNFTLGNITALAGLNDDSRYLQISAAVQPGNSGGPLLDYNGTLTGVVSSKLDAIKMASRTGDIPQNVNFALKAITVMSFLDANRVSYSADSGTPMQPVDLAEHARLASVFIRCVK